MMDDLVYGEPLSDADMLRKGVVVVRTCDSVVHSKFEIGERMTTEKFDPYAYLRRITSTPDDGERVMLSDQYRASDVGEMLKTALIAIELLAGRIAELEKER